jgi:glycine dehydrogenase subunit 1
VLLPKNADEVVGKMLNKGFSAGFPLGRFYKGMDNYLLVTVTEKRTREEIEKFAKVLEEVLCS